MQEIMHEKKTADVSNNSLVNRNRNIWTEYGQLCLAVVGQISTS